MQASLNHVQLESLLRELDSTAPDCREKIATMRRMMDEACDKRSITLSQWRSLLERVALVQANCFDLRPDAWRHPPSHSQDLNLAQGVESAQARGRSGRRQPPTDLLASPRSPHT